MDESQPGSESAARPVVNTFPEPALFSSYEITENLGVGAYGHVYRSIHKPTREVVALKKFKMQNETEGFPICAIREIMLLSKLDHPNIVKLREVVTSPANEHNRQLGDVFLVFEYMEHNLGSLIEEKKVRNFSYAQVKGYMKQIFTGLFFCHTNKVLHRDIKPTNILLNRKGMVKIADFGLSRAYTDVNKEYTTCVVTRWYRAPELLFQIKKYSTAIDIWSVGCLLAELITGVPTFPGPSDKEQLETIFRTCGSPNSKNWASLMTMPEYEKHQASFSKTHRNNLQKNVSAKAELPNVDRHAYELLEKLLALDPAQRPSANSALDAEFFWTDPMPLEPAELPVYGCDSVLIQKRFSSQKERTDHNRAPPKQPQPQASAPGQGHGHGHGNGNGQAPPPPQPCSQKPPHSHSHSHSHSHQSSRPNASHEHISNSHGHHHGQPRPPPIPSQAQLHPQLQSHSHSQPPQPHPHAQPHSQHSQRQNGSRPHSSSSHQHSQGHHHHSHHTSQHYSSRPESDQKRSRHADQKPS